MADSKISDLPESESPNADAEAIIAYSENITDFKVRATSRTNNTYSDQ